MNWIWSKNWKPLCITMWTIVISIYVGMGIAHLWAFRDSGFCGWPAVTICKICDEKVWVWQPNERRSYKIPIEGCFPEGAGVIHMEATLSAIVHRECTGEPVIDPIQVNPPPVRIKI